jgi:hypothetical protein
MSIGSILVGIALALVTGAYLARPFRTATVDLDRAIETWVAEVRAEKQRSGGAEEQRSEKAEEKVNYCSQCGRRVGPDDHFCAGCGTPLRGDVE